MKKNIKNSAKAPKVTKKEVVAKPQKIAKVVVPKYELVTFSVKATIPTQMYGNIMPEIVVKAKTIEEAKAIVMPAIESLYVEYAEKPRDGSSISFMSKANVTATEKKVNVIPKPVAPAPAPEKKPEAPAQAPASAPVAPVKTPAQESADELADDLAKSPAYTKAENAIKNSMSLDALNMIEDQIQKSVKLTADEKPMLLTDVLKKRKEFAL